MIADHHRQRLAVAMLAFAQAHDGGLVGRIDAEMKSADAFDGHDPAREQFVNTLRDGIGGRDRSGRSATASQTCGPQSQQALGCA